MSCSVDISDISFTPRTSEIKECGSPSCTEEERNEAGRSRSDKPRDCLCLSSSGCILLWAFVALSITAFKHVALGGFKNAPVTDHLFVLFSIICGFLYIVAAVGRNRNMYFLAMIAAFVHALHELINLAYIVYYIIRAKKRKNVDEDDMLLIASFGCSLAAHIIVFCLFIRGRCL